MPLKGVIMRTRIGLGIASSVVLAAVVWSVSEASKHEQVSAGQSATNSSVSRRSDIVAPAAAAMPRGVAGVHTDSAPSAREQVVQAGPKRPALARETTSPDPFDAIPAP